jgi:hypothetical protein
MLTAFNALKSKVIVNSTQIIFCMLHFERKFGHNLRRIIYPNFFSRRNGVLLNRPKDDVDVDGEKLHSES